MRRIVYLFFVAGLDAISASCASEPYLGQSAVHHQACDGLLKNWSARRTRRFYQGSVRPRFNNTNDFA